jgi:hypothetical protein
VVFHRRHASFNAGVLESTLRSIVPPLSGAGETLMLVDEFEAITEPGRAADLLNGLVELTVDRGAVGVYVTHLAEDLSPLPETARIDGIFAEGLTDDLALRVDYQPRFGTLGKSTPEFIVSRLVANADDRTDRQGFQRLAAAVGEEASVGRDPSGLADRPTEVVEQLFGLTGGLVAVGCHTRQGGLDTVVAEPVAFPVGDVCGRLGVVLGVELDAPAVARSERLDAVFVRGEFGGVRREFDDRRRRRGGEPRCSRSRSRPSTRRDRPAPPRAAGGRNTHPTPEARRRRRRRPTRRTN